jgi:hypothetical protein
MVLGDGVAVFPQVGSIVIRCYEFERMLAFWQEALHYVPREPAKRGWVVLRDPEGIGPNLSLDQYPERRSGKRSRLHLSSSSHAAHSTDRLTSSRKAFRKDHRAYISRNPSFS